jgi:hypothetical protein
MTLLEECTEALKGDFRIFSKSEGIKIEDDFFSLPFTSWGRIDWDLIKNKLLITTKQQLTEALQKNKRSALAPIYIIWDEAKLPIIESKFKTIISHLNNVTAVSFDTWLYCPSEAWVIEFFHDGETTIGFLD